MGSAGGSGAWKKALPIVVVLIVVGAVIAAVLASGGEDDSATSTSTSVAGPAAGADAVLLDPAVSWDTAKAAGTTESIDWGKRCDTDLGLMALPLFPQQECFKPFTGDNGGESSTGVTADSIKVVVYEHQANDPVLSFIYAQIKNTDTPDDEYETYANLNQIFAKYYETYGRKVELVRFDATGNISDSVAAIADAETIANDIKPFMVLGGPSLTNAFADTLAKNKVMCVSCTPGQPQDWYVERAPYVWDIQKNQDQNQLMIAEYVGKRLAGSKAVHAGDPALAAKDRVFGYIYVASSDSAKALAERFNKELDGYGVTIANSESYALPTDLPNTARDMITRMKEKGVTTVLFQGDPLAPQTLTKVAAEQNFSPEWIITGSALVDTSAFSRTYDQSQWAHAFGPSNLFARIPPDKAGGGYLHQWYFGTPPPAEKTVAVIVPNLQFLYAPLQAVGTALTPENVQKVLFGAQIIPSTPVTPQISYGNRGVWPQTDYSALDDQTEAWWNPDATGVDELGVQGKGMWAYVDGGKRYLPGEWPKSAPKVFDSAGAVTLYDTPPPGAELKDYTPLK